MLPVAWHDVLRLEKASEFRFTCSDKALPVDQSNLVVQAARLIQDVSADHTLSISIHLEKVVPYGAGLGSGSSDAAATLSALNNVLGLNLGSSHLYQMASRLGSDVPFFLEGVPSVASGRGEVLSPILSPDGTPYELPFSLVISVPHVHVSTADAYKAVTPEDSGSTDFESVILSNDLDRWKKELVNDFQVPITANHPEIKSALDVLIDHGAGYTSMSGSGSAVFGVFESAAKATHAFEQLESEGHRVWTRDDAT